MREKVSTPGNRVKQSALFQGMDDRPISGASPLSSNWIIWAHLPHDTDWTLDSYIQICNVNNVSDAAAITSNLPSDLATNCMLFVMREGISPTWEDDKNRDGGSFSYKLQNKFVNEAWKELSLKLYGEVLAGDELNAKVNGITVSPKKNFCIVKVWMADCKFTDPSIIDLGNPHFDARTCIFKRHNPED